jgi:hypothetical protein
VSRRSGAHRSGGRAAGAVLARAGAEADSAGCSSTRCGSATRASRERRGSWRRRRARRRSCGGRLLREMRERGGINPDYTTVIKIGRIGDASSLAREMHEGRRAGRRGGESKAMVIARRARKEQLRSGKAVRTGVMQRRFDAQRKTNDEVTGLGGPSGIEPACSRVQAEVFYRWPARLVSAGECACKATGHARAG